LGGGAVGFLFQRFSPCQGGCITKLETFIQEHLRVIGAVGIGIACVQVRVHRVAWWGYWDGRWAPGTTHACLALHRSSA
jgi:hypothetical protein